MEAQEALAAPPAQKDALARASIRQLLKRFRAEDQDGSTLTGKETTAPDFILVTSIEREWWALETAKRPIIDSIYVLRPG